MTMSVEAAAQALREATRQTVRRYSTWYLIQGVLMVIAGIVALLYPFVSSVALVLFLGWILIISGIVQGISLIGAQNAPNFWLQLVSAVLSIIVGVLFLRRPGEGVVTLALLLIVFFMVEGFAKIVFSLTIRPLPNWGWVLASGIVGILLSFYLLANVTTTAVWLLGVLLGIQLSVKGWLSARWRGRRAGARKLPQLGLFWPATTGLLKCAPGTLDRRQLGAQPPQFDRDQLACPGVKRPSIYGRTCRADFRGVRATRLSKFR